jgi:hypothetical protein
MGLIPIFFLAPSPRVQAFAGRERHSSQAPWRSPLTTSMNGLAFPPSPTRCRHLAQRNEVLPRLVSSPAWQDIARVPGGRAKGEVRGAFSIRGAVPPARTLGT